MIAGDHRICFVGDSFVHGTADADCLGWAGRVAAAARKYGYDLTAYNLGVRRDTSADIAARWQHECAMRLPEGCSQYLVFSFGANDMTTEGKALRVPVTDSIANFHSIISKATARYPTLVIGPLPVSDAAQDNRIEELCKLYAQTAKELGVPYLPLAGEMFRNSAWIHAVAAGDGTHPDASGYTLIAERVQQWPAWWFSSSRVNGPFLPG